MLAWIGVSFATALLQVALGTSVPFAAITLGIFLLMPLPLRILQASDSVGSVLLVATMGKLFIVSQWMKIFLQQPADAHLAEPVLTAMALFFGLMAFTVAAAGLSPLLPRLRVQALRPSMDPEFLVRFGWLVFGLSLFGSVMHIRLLAGANPDEPEMGQGRVIWNYLELMMPLAVAIFTARCAIRSSGRQFIDLPVVLGIAACVGVGLLINARSVMLSGLVTFAIAYLSYGGRVRYWHVVLLLAGGFVMHRYIFPAIDAQRSLDRDLPLMEYLMETLRIIFDVLDYETWQASHGQSLLDTYESYVTRLYYGVPFGLLDRFTPSQVDEVVSYVTEYGALGSEYVFYPLMRVIPNLIYRMFEWERPLFGSELLQTTIFSTDQYSSPNYGLFAELYGYAGLGGVLMAGAPVLFIYLFALHAVYGGFRNNYFAAFCAGGYLFVIADADMGEMIGRALEQAFVYVVIAMAGRALFLRGGVGAASVLTARTNPTDSA